jgi:hypothetical protein
VTGGTDARPARGHPEQARQGIGATASEETTVRHALVTVHLIHEARAAGVPERQLEDAPPDPPVTTGAQRRRLSALFRRARALVVRPT